MADIFYPPLCLNMHAPKPPSGIDRHATHMHMPIIDIVWDDVFLSRAFMILNVDGIYTSAGRNRESYYTERSRNPFSMAEETTVSQVENSLQVMLSPGIDIYMAGETTVSQAENSLQAERCVFLDEPEAFGVADDPRLAELLTYRNGTGPRATLHRQPAESGTAERLTVEHRTDEH
ncbi:hypothetical protein BU17DRAFT_69472 [Hysterangium stoloniferum]|nr:hypothetical protein BU17DRAFT_69472 [Hysterangium stoloniferum]